jgi:hypothetical protein
MLPGMTDEKIVLFGSNEYVPLLVDSREIESEDALL